ncbi:MAG: hypothetical protein FJ313_05720 [Gemmatimonadetes bacterium]|nr:hypothetical protein [Gemmatimonadota bacterium]
MGNSTWGASYMDLGVSPVINAIGNVSILGGSTPSPAVRKAIEEAHDAFVPMWDLARAAGEAVARMLGVEAAWITSGAASAITLSAAACIAGDDGDRLRRLPDTTGMPNRILIQKRQRYSYDRALELAGAKIVEVGTDDGTTEGRLTGAIDSRTAAVHFLADERIVDPRILTFEQVLRIAHSKNVPLIVDAAGQVYPLENLSKYAKAGADFVCYGAKYIQSVHSTGFVCGSEKMISKLRLHSFVAFESLHLRSLGRPHKVDRQEIIGTVAALREWLTMNHEERLATLDARTDAIAAHLRGIPGLKATPERQTVGGSSYGLRLELDPAVAGKTLDDLVELLKGGDPPVWTRVIRGSMLIAVQCLNEGEDDIVGRRIAEALRA